MKKLLILFCWLGCHVLTQAQTTISATGGNGTAGSGTISYSVGQTIYTTISSYSGSTAQGVQQAYEISVVTDIEKVDVTLDCSIYPNPVSNNLTLRMKNYDKDDLWYKLFDVNGKMLESNRITGTQIDISMSKMVPSTYFLKVVDNLKEIKTFKIIKK